MSENKENQENLDNKESLKENPIKNAPQRMTTENFKLDITEEQLALSSTAEMGPRQKVNTQMKKAYGRQFYTEKEKKQEEKAHKKRNKIKAGKNKRVFKIMWLVMVVLVSLTLASYLIDGANDFLAANRTQENSVTIDLPENITLQQLSVILEEAEVIKEKTFFEIFFKLKDIKGKDNITRVKSGKIIIDTNMDYQEIIDKLISGPEREVVEIVLYDGMNILDIANKLEEEGVCNAKEFLREASSQEYMKASFPHIQALSNVEERYYLLEGYLFPDTYLFYKESDPSTVIEKLLGNFKTKTSFLDSMIEKSGYTKDEIIVLASIIQREAANVNDMYRVSAVLHNRLKNGEAYGLLKLQCDSTTFYPYHRKSDLPEGKADYVSKYDTYNIERLPKGAICSPGTDAIKAALMPEEGYLNYFYFCHSADGTAYYAETDEGHQENLVKAGLE